MGIHRMVFLTIGNFVSPTSSPLSGYLKGRTWAAPPERKGLPALGCCGSGDLVEGRVGNVVGFNLWSSLNHSRQDLRHLGIGSPVVCFRDLSVIPQTDSERFRSVWDNECDFVAEPGLFSKQGKNVLFDPLREFRNAIGFQLHGNSACKHVNLLGCHYVGRSADLRNEMWITRRLLRR